MLGGTLQDGESNGSLITDHGGEEGSKLLVAVAFLGKPVYRQIGLIQFASEACCEVIYHKARDHV